ncbi:MAG: PTS sugar transporter [Mycoplasmataceae bacterium]|nr:PTS sugar transporter [Mycoplasmataceae bacterium]
MENTQVKPKRLDSNSSGAREFLSKLSRGLMIPIAVLPIAGLFLGVGAGISNVLIAAGVTRELNPGAFVVGDVMASIGDVIFGNLPILFAVAVAIAFTEDSGVAGFSALIMWIVFNAFQANFIHEINDADGLITGYSILFFDNVPTSVVTSNSGITSLQTSAFGGLTIGFLTAAIYNKFHKMELPKVLGFFSGTRSVPIIAFLMAPIIACIFLITWPFFGVQLNNLGTVMAGMPAGTNSLMFGIIERALIPFGLHHAFYTPLWFTSVGGSVYDAQGQALAFGDQNIWFEFQTQGWSYDWIDYNQVQSIPDGSVMVEVNPIINNQGETVGYITAGEKPGMYMQGKYPFMIFGLPAAGAAMVMAAKKENREIAFSVIGAAAFTSFLTGITEPIEYTFLFLAPALYYGFHIWMAGISFWLMNLLGANLGMTFSGGIIDFALYGILADATGFGVQSWDVIIIGVPYAVIYFFVFYFYIKHFDIPTPGREPEGTVIAMKSKADYLASKQDGRKNNSSINVKKGIDPETGISLDRSERVKELLGYLGGFENLTSIDACITRLRISVVDKSLIDEVGLKSLGAMGVVYLGKNAVQVIYGAEADRFKVDLKDYKKHLGL